MAEGIQKSQRTYTERCRNNNHGLEEARRIKTKAGAIDAAKSTKSHLKNIL